MNKPELPPEPNAAKDPSALTGSAPPSATPPISGGHGGQPVASPESIGWRPGVIGIAVVIVIGALALGFFPRWRQRQTAQANMIELATPTVSVVLPAYHTPGEGLTLPAEIRPWREASIYARVNGYLKDWLVDIGAHVQPNQKLAEIETPDLDQQLDQARAAPFPPSCSPRELGRRTDCWCSSAPARRRISCPQRPLRSPPPARRRPPRLYPQHAST